MSEPTRRLVEGYFDLRDLGPFEIKGVSEPVPTFELLGVGPLRSRFDVSRTRGFSRFVGRDREMAVLDEALAAVATGQPRIIGIVGEAGVGKSRLVHEFLERTRPNFPSSKGQCAPHTKSIPLLPVMEALRGAIGIADLDDAETCRVKITGFMLRSDPSLADDVPFMLDFLGVRDPEQPGPELEPAERIERLIRFANTVTRSRIERGAYGIRIIEASTGETATEAYNFQAFLGEINLASKVFPDGREEWIRGVNFVGTPLNAIRGIVAAGERHEVDNAYCGAESGYVPLTTISPAIVVSELELQSKAETPYSPYIFPIPWERAKRFR